MAYVSISSSQTDAKSPVDDTLMDTIRTDLDDLDSRVTAQSGAGASGLETLEQKVEAEHSRVFTDRLANSAYKSFAFADVTLIARLVETYTAASTTMRLTWNPIYASDSDKDLDVTTG